ncbi:TPA: YodC family protein [Klebsiella pneumoniae]
MKMEEKFEPGTLVQLKSGGPIMTVERFDKSLDKYCCEWFSNGKRNSEMFKATSIQKFKPSVGIL